MADEQQASFVSTNITDHGITDEGVEEFIQNLKTRRENAEAAAAYRKADAFVKNNLPLFEEPTRIRIGDYAEINVGFKTTERKAQDAKSGVQRRKEIVYLTDGGFSDTKAN